MKNLILTLLICCVFTVGAHSQNLTSITCVGSWGGSSATCSTYSTGQTGDMACDCSATCGSTCESIDAEYHVFWRLNDPTFTGQGSISGQGLPSAVQVKGSLTVVCGLITDAGRGYNEQDCDLNVTGGNFSVSCGGSGTTKLFQPPSAYVAVRGDGDPGDNPRTLGLNEWSAMRINVQNLSLQTYLALIRPLAARRSVAEFGD